MSCGKMHASLPQAMVDQTPRYDNARRKKKGRRPNQVVGKGGIIRSDKRLKAKFL